MLRGGTRTFTDPDQYLANFPEAKIRLVFTEPGPFKARLTWVSLPHLCLFSRTESLPRIAYLSWASGRNHLSFPLSTAFNPVWAGIALQRGDIIFHGQDGRAHDRTEDSSRWGHISVAPRHLAAFADTVTAGELATPQQTRLLRPSSAAGQLLHLHRMACRLAENEPRVLAHPEAARALEHDLLHGIIRCLSSGDDHGNPATRSRRAAIMTKFETLVGNSNLRLSIPKISEFSRRARADLENVLRGGLGHGPRPLSSIK